MRLRIKCHPKLIYGPIKEQEGSRDDDQMCNDDHQAIIYWRRSVLRSFSLSVVGGEAHKIDN